MTRERLASWHLLVNNSPAVRNVYARDYWEAVDKLNTNDDKFLMYLIIGISFGVVLIAVIVVVIICVKKRGSSEDSGLMNG